MATEFDLIRALASLVDKYFPKRAQIVSSRQKDVYSRMYSRLLDSDIVDEKTLEREIFDEEGTSTSYHVLRNQLKDKLFNMVFLLEFTESNASHYRRAIYDNARTVFLSQVLDTFGIGQIALRLARSGLKQAKTYELTVNCIHFLRILRYHAAFSGDKELYAQLSAQKKHYMGLYSCELCARELWESLTVELSITGSRTDALAKFAMHSSEEAFKLYGEHPTFNIGLEYYRIATMALELNEDFHGAELLCNQAKVFLDEHPQFHSVSLYGVFALRKLECALHIGDYEGAEAAAADCQKLYGIGETTWFFFKEYEFQLHMHELRFDAAEKVFNQVTSHPRFETLQESRRQRWELFEYYLEYVKGMFKDPGFAKRRLASLQRYKSSSTYYTKDKTEFNLAIMIIEFLILLDSKQFGVVIERADALRVYRQRYLQKTRASKAFFQFLISVAKYADDPKSMQKWRKREEDEILSGLAAPISNLEGMQILRFSWLYERILAQLGAE